MVRKFVWVYVKVLLAIAISVAFGWLLLGWKYGFQVLLKNEMFSDVAVDVIIILVVAFVATTANFFLEGRKR